MFTKSALAGIHRTRHMVYLDKHRCGHSALTVLEIVRKEMKESKKKPKLNTPHLRPKEVPMRPRADNASLRI